MAYFPIALSSTPATFDTGMLGRVVNNDDVGKRYVFCKNTDASSLASGNIVTLEDPSVFSVDICGTLETPFGVVVNDITGAVAAVNDGVWIQVKGNCYIKKGLATSSVAISAGDNLKPRNALGQVTITSGTVGSKSMEVLNVGIRFARAISAVASSATTNVLAHLYG